MGCTVKERRWIDSSYTIDEFGFVLPTAALIAESARPRAESVLTRKGSIHTDRVLQAGRREGPQVR
jgi:hypothetical protein